MKKPFLSIITPTYNRAYILPQCYMSLVKQTSKNFEWILIDDGSQDRTEELVQLWLAEGKVDIKYIRQPNGGKHRAHNNGVKHSCGELVVCVDSDDALTENAVQRTEEVWSELSCLNVAGILALRGDHDGKPICSEIPKNLKISTTYDLAHTYQFEGDTILIYRRDMLMNHLFPEFAGEKFLSECAVYYEIDKEAPMYLLNEVLYLCEYLPDGLSYQYHALLKKNPIGTAYCYSVYLSSSKQSKYKLKYAIITNAYRSLIANENRPKGADNKLLLMVTYPLGILYRTLRLNQTVSEMRP